MKTALNLVRGAVGTKDLFPVMTHFHVYGGRVQGSNGRLTIDAPCAELSEFSITVPAEFFLKAIDACDGEPELAMPSADKLLVKRGSFRAELPLASNDAFPKVEAGLVEREYAITEPLLPVLAKLAPFMDTSISRPWMQGVLFRNGWAWATNNTALARVPIAYELPELMFPSFVIDELLRIGQEPLGLCVGETWATLRFEGDWWVRSQKVIGDWPDVVKFMDSFGKAKRKPTKAEALQAAVSKVVPFCTGSDRPIVKTDSRGVGTEGGSVSARAALDGLPDTKWYADSLQIVLAIAQEIDLSRFPNACPWSGDGIEGAIAGVS